MSKKPNGIICSLETLAQVAMTGIRLGWNARDKFCTERHCAKCHRKDGHGGIPLPQSSKDKLGRQIAGQLWAEMEKQAARRRYLSDDRPRIYDATGGVYDGGEPN